LKFLIKLPAAPETGFPLCYNSTSACSVESLRAVRSLLQFKKQHQFTAADEKHQNPVDVIEYFNRIHNAYRYFHFDISNRIDY